MKTVPHLGPFEAVSLLAIGFAVLSFAGVIAFAAVRHAGLFQG
jgi:hypothetical protein